MGSEERGAGLEFARDKVGAYGSKKRKENKCTSMYLHGNMANDAVYLQSSCRSRRARRALERPDVAAPVAVHVRNLPLTELPSLEQPGRRVGSEGPHDLLPGLVPRLMGWE